MNTVVKGCLGIGLVVVLCSCTATTPEPSETVYQFFDAINQRDVNSVMGCFTPEIEEGIKAGVNLGGKLFTSIIGFGNDFEAWELVPFLAMFDDRTPELYAEVVEEKIEGDYAEVFAGNGNGEIAARFDLMLIEGEWKIYNIEEIN